jgi:signal transduction histidine kinase/ActR/RegA family two-component response regulator
VNDPDDPGAAGPPPETLQELYDLAPCGYLTTRCDGIITRVNATLLDLVRETRDAVIGRRFQTILTPSACTFYRTHCAPLLQQHGFLTNISLDLACVGGGPLPALVSWRRVDDPRGHLLGYRVTVLGVPELTARELLAGREHARQRQEMLRELTADLDRRVEARTAELVQAHKMESLGQLTGGVAHDFNNLLTPILITLDILRTRFLRDERALRMAASAISAAERARLLISRLLAFARRQHLRAQAVDLGRLAEGMQSLITQTVGPLISLRIAMPAGLPLARADQQQLEMALLNLCVNARDAMPNGGHLTIVGDVVAVGSDADRDLTPGEYVRLAVADNGSGMDEQTLRRAAEPFYSTKTIGKGTGLGLSMVHGLAAQLGGKLVLESTPGHGTTATVWLPVDADTMPPTETVTAEPAAAPRSGLSILLVDDDELVRSATSEMLTDLSHTTIQAASGTEALEALGHYASIDLLITDYLMPGMTGVELARIARLSRPSLPVLLVTGYASFKDADGGGLPRLAKPFSTRDLSNMIANTLAAPVAVRNPQRAPA